MRPFIASATSETAPSRPFSTPFLGAASVKGSLFSLNFLLLLGCCGSNEGVPLGRAAFEGILS
jgi:hypothetical protein